MTKNTGKGLSKAEMEEIAKQVAQGQCYYSHETVELLVQEVRRLRAWDDHLMRLYRESVDDNTRIEYEADWLAEKLLINCEHCGADIFGSCFLRVNNICDTHGRRNGKEKIAAKHWRETARKAVQND